MLTIAAALALAAAEAPPPLRPGLEPLAFLVGSCWEGTMPNGRWRDVHCFESLYGGQHVSDRHVVHGSPGNYRGETLYSWDRAANSVSYTYWNSIGGVSRGTMRVVGDRLEFGDEPHASPTGERIMVSTHWRRDGDGYVAVTTSRPPTPSLDRTIRFTRTPPVAVSTSRGADGRHSLVHEVIVEAAADEVWQAIATPEGWRTWAVPVSWAPEADVIETSYTPTARSGDPSTIRQRVVAAIPGRLLVFRTIRAPQGFPDFDTYAQVTSAFELEPAGDGRTRVRLTGTGYADTEAGRRLLGFFREGNRVSLERLRQRFRTGPLDWAAVLRASD
jgi:uncharacterized protein YndB with AHSA1/START domain